MYTDSSGTVRKLKEDIINMQNLHTHTTYVDGTLTPEEMIEYAIKTGIDSLGFSEHSYVTFDENYAMSPDETHRYINELRNLKDIYQSVIEIFIGLEVDYYTVWKPKTGLDYIIGTSHYIEAIDSNGKALYPSIDSGAVRQKEIVDLYFNGDFYSMAEKYFSTITNIVQITGADIIGHFDLVTKYNFNNSLFDENHPRYIKAALDAMEAILEHCNIFEVNTGAMFRFQKPEPYPSEFLLKELFKRGGEVILGSDSHNGQSLCYKFDEMTDLLKYCGFKYQKRLTDKGFIDIAL